MRGRGASTYRATVVFAAMFAVSLAALAIAAGTAWVRCGRGDNCSGDLAFAVVAAAPAALLAGVIVLLIRKRSESVLLSRALLVLALGLAAMPLAAFVVRDGLTLAAVALLFAALVFFAVMEDQPDADIAAGPRARTDAASDAMRWVDVSRRIDAAAQQIEALVGELEGQPGGRARASELRNGTAPLNQAGRNHDVTVRAMTLVLNGLNGVEDVAHVYNMLLDDAAVKSLDVREYEGSRARLEIVASDGQSLDSLRDAIGRTSSHPTSCTETSAAHADGGSALRG